ncbi:MAG: YciI family protein [Acidobacteriota bacterium]
MQYMMMIKATKDYEAGLPPSRELVEGMGKLSAEMIRAGKLVASGGLEPSSKGCRLQYSGGKRTLIDGPFAETRELVGGYAILEAQSKEEAIQFADRVVEVHIQAGIEELEMEIRALYDPAGCSAANRSL